MQKVSTRGDFIVSLLLSASVEIVGVGLFYYNKNISYQNILDINIFGYNFFAAKKNVTKFLFVTKKFSI